MKLQTINRYLAWIACLGMLAGCAGQETFRRGQALLDAGKAKEGLEQVRKAMEEQTGNLEYKAYYYRQRDGWVNRLLREADNARVARSWDAAETVYRRALDIDAANERAQDGLKEVEAGRRHDDQLADAEELLDKSDLDAARNRVRLVLAEDAANTSAKSLAVRIEQKRAAAVTPASRLHEKFRRPVSLELRDTPIKTVFEMLSKAAGVNFVLDRDLRPDLKVSIFVKHTTIEDALRNILSINQLSRKVLNESSLLIYPNSKKGDYEELVVRTFYLGSASASQAMNLLKTVVKTKDIFIDEKLNILVMRDSLEAVQLAEKLLANYDIGDPEVLLEVEVLEVSNSKLLDMGIKYPNQLAVGVNGTPGVGKMTFKDAKHFSADMGVLTITDPTFVLNLQATDGSNKLLANPRIRVKNHKKAKIHIGDRVPVITTTSTSTGFSSESVNYLDVGLKLDVEPVVMVNEEVSLDISLEVSSITNQVTSKNGTLTYQLGSRNANTTLQLKNGETQVLAGLINDSESASADRVPGLSSLPLIGRLFASKRDKHDKTEIVLLITPRIVRNIAPPDAAYVEFTAGTETGNSVPVMQNGGASMPMPTELPQPEPITPAQLDMPPQAAPIPEPGQIPIPAIPPQPLPVAPNAAAPSASP